MEGERCPVCLVFGMHAYSCPLVQDHRRRQVVAWVVCGLMAGLAAGYAMCRALGIIGPIGGAP